MASTSVTFVACILAALFGNAVTPETGLSVRNKRQPPPPRVYPDVGYMLVWEVCELFRQSDDNIRDWFRNHGLIAEAVLCPYCRQQMKEGKKKDTWQWVCRRCPAHPTKPGGDNAVTRSMWTNSFFKGMHLSPRQVFAFMYFWSLNIQSHEFLEPQIGLARQTVTDYRSFMRELCMQHYVRNPLLLGGPGFVVQIDESLFKHAKYWVGHALGDRQKWVFGIFQPAQQGLTSQVVLVKVDRRDEATLAPLIVQYIARGTTIWSDGWAAYINIANLRDANNIPMNYRHGTVNHRHHFRDPVTGVHTNNVESMWNAAKFEIKRMRGTLDDQIPGYLEEYMWRFNVAKHKSSTFQALIETLREQYPH